MKNLFSLFCTLLLSCSLHAQTLVEVAGLVTDTNGAGVANVPVVVAIPPNPIYNYSNLVYTNANGQYSDSFTAPVPQGIVNAEMIDCDSSSIVQSLTWFGDSTYLVADFVYCDVNASDCGVSISNPTSGGGTAALTANPWGQAPFSFQWSDGSTGPGILVSASGVYCVDMIDAAGCQATACDSVIIDEGCGVVVQASPAGGLYAVGLGQAPFTYVWTDGQTTQTATGLPMGPIDVTVTDAQGCTGVTSVTVDQPTEIMLAMAQDPVSCTGGDDGAASV
ncbi:MAG: hypothetical protein AAGD05_16020, partial [Bacteroidota bacterium]